MVVIHMLPEGPIFEEKNKFCWRSKEIGKYRQALEMKNFKVFRNENVKFSNEAFFEPNSVEFAEETHQ